MPRFTVAAIACALALAAAPAAPAAVIDIGPGEQADVAMDSGGTAHVAWNTSDDTAVIYCSLAPGASSCSPSSLNPVTDLSSARPYVFLSGSTVRVLTRRCCGGGSHALIFTSANGGQSFGQPDPAGTLNPSGDAAFGPGTGISVVTDSLIATYFQRMPADGSPAATAEVPLTNSYNYHGAVTVTGGRPLVAFDDLTNTAFTYTNGGDPNSGSSWPTPVGVGPGVEPHLATGPSGTYLLTRTTSPNGDMQLRIRKFNGTTFGTEQTVRYASAYTEGSIGSAALAEDPTGRLHAVWREGGGNPTKLMYSSSADGVTWTQAVQAAEDSSIEDLRLSVGADGNGVAIWDRGIDGHVRAARVPPPPPPPPPPAPKAAFTQAPPRICTGRMLFDGSSSQPQSSTIPIVDYTWTITDTKYQLVLRGGGWFPPSVDVVPVPDVKVIDTGASPQARAVFQWLVYEDPVTGDYSSLRPPVHVKLTVTDSTGAQGSTEKQVNFLHPDPAPGESLADCPHALRVTVPVNLASPVARVHAGGISVFVRCPAGGVMCLGSLQLSQVRARASASRRRAIAKKRLYVIPAGRKGKITLRLNRLGKSLLRHHRLRSVRAVFSFRQFGSTAKNRVTKLRVRR